MLDAVARGVAMMPALAIFLAEGLVPDSVALGCAGVAFDEVDAPPLVLDATPPPPAVLALSLAGRHRGHRPRDRKLASGHHRGALGRQPPARSDVVLGDAIAELVGDVNALADRAHGDSVREVTGGHCGPGLWRERAAHRVDVVLGDAVAVLVCDVEALSVRVHRKTSRRPARRHPGRALRRQPPARTDVVLGDTVSTPVGDVDAFAVGGDRHPAWGATGGHPGRALRRQPPARADVVLGDAAAILGDAKAFAIGTHRHRGPIEGVLYERWTLGRQPPARADVVLSDAVAIGSAREVGALAVGAHRHLNRLTADAHGRRGLGRQRPARADVVLGDAGWSGFVGEGLTDVCDIYAPAVRADRHAAWGLAGGHRGRRQRGEQPARPNVVLGDVVAALVGDIGERGGLSRRRGP